MKIYIKTLGSYCAEMQIEETGSILQVKEFIHKKEGIPIDEIRLVLGGKPLEDDQTLNHYNIQDEMTIFLVLKLKQTND